MIILSLDTASNNCAVTLVENGRMLARVLEPLGKGHAEKLIGQITQVMQDAGKTLADVSRIAVNIGPGSFTGVRVGVSTARALALALKIPAIGVSSLESLAYETLKTAPFAHICVVIDAGRDMFYRQDFDKDLKPSLPACVQKYDDLIASLPQEGLLTGPAAKNIAEKSNNAHMTIFENDAADVETYAHLGALKEPMGAPKPLYLRDADAKPQIGYALPRKT